MKTSFTLHAFLVASAATLSLSVAPVLHAVPPPDPQNSKIDDRSTAQRNSSTTGTGTTAASAPDKTSSKDTDNALDKNPSTAATGSAEKSATKEPTGTTDDNNKMASGKTEKTEAGPVSDKEFVQNAAQGGMTEVELGKLAQQKGESADVKQFGSHMVTDHSKANDELKAVALKKGIDVPAGLDAKHQAEVNHFSTLSGKAFDRAYIHAMVKDHEKTAAAFRSESANGQDPDVKNFAGETLKVINSHLDHIKGLENSVK